MHCNEKMEREFFDRRQIRKETCLSHVGTEARCNLAVPTVPVKSDLT